MTPLQLTVIGGMLQNQGIIANANAVAAVNKYETAKPIANIVAASVLANTMLYNAVTNSNLTTTVQSATYYRMQSLGSTSCSALGDSVPSGITTFSFANTAVAYGTSFPPLLSGYTKYMQDTISGKNDLSKFCQIFSGAADWRQGTNNTINAASSVNRYLGITFSGMNNLISGDVTSVTTNTANFGADAEKLGNLYNTAKLDLIGTPIGVVKQIGVSGGLPTGFTTQLLLVGIPQAEIQLLRRSSYSASDEIQSLIFKAMQNTTGESLTQVLQVLDVRTEKLTTMADLLELSKIFPNSYKTLLAPTTTGPVNIYDSNGAVNTNLVTALPSYLVKADSPGYPYERLKTFTNPSIALSSKALQASLQQVRGISDTTIVDFGRVTKGIQNVNDLPLVKAQTQPVNPAVLAAVQASLAVGSGAGGRVSMFDIIGSAAGANLTQPLTNVVNLINSTNTTEINEVYLAMSKLLVGDYNVYSDNQSGAVTSVTITSAGSGYDTVPTVIFDGGTPTTPAVAKVTMSGNIRAGTGTIGSVTLVSGGSGYQSVPNVVLSAGNGSLKASMKGTKWTAIKTPYSTSNWAANINSALGNLCDVANTKISNWVSANPAIAQQVTANYLTFASAITTQAKNIAAAGIQPSTISANVTPSIFAWGQALEQYGPQTEPGGPVDYLTYVVDKNNITGQSIIAGLREGENLAKLQEIGINPTTNVPGST